MKIKLKESDYASKVVDWLIDQKWEVYQEVSFGQGGNRADIIAVQNKIRWVIEVKTCLSMSILEQIFRWRGRAHYISIAIPKSNKNRAFTYRILRDYGIGIIEVDNKNGRVIQRESPILNRKPHLSRDILNESMKSYASAGNDQNKFWSPFQQTKDNIIRIVSKNQGITFKELMNDHCLQHHYSSTASARSNIIEWIRKGVIKKLKLSKDKPLKIYLNNT